MGYRLLEPRHPSGGKRGGEHALLPNPGVLQGERGEGAGCAAAGAVGASSRRWSERSAASSIRTSCRSATTTSWRSSSCRATKRQSRWVLLQRRGRSAEQISHDGAALAGGGDRRDEESEEGRLHAAEEVDERAPASSRTSEPLVQRKLKLAGSSASQRPAKARLDGRTRTQADHDPLRRRGRLQPPHGRGRAGDAGASQDLARDESRAEIASYRGRIVNTAGDSVLAEFPSVVNAVECAVRDAAEPRRAERRPWPPDRRMHFRIGINLGDVLVEGDDLFGEGVNIAARLQSLAEPGGILVSGSRVRAGAEQAHALVRFSRAARGQEHRRGGTRPGASCSMGVRERETRRARGPIPASEGAATRSGYPSRKTKPRRRYSALGANAAREALPRLAATAAVLVAAFFTINMLTESDSLWFQWPTLAIIVVFTLRTISAWSR